MTKGGNPNTALTHSFDYATANGTAAAPSDYTAASGSITFQTTDTTKTIQVQSVTDGVVDSASNETFFVNLTTNAGTNGATLADSQGQGLIADVDASVPSVPQNMRSNPNIQSNPGGNYSVLWNASTGPVSYYRLEELDNTHTFIQFWNVNVPSVSKGFTNHPAGEYYYRVQACTAGGQCSAFSNEDFILVCNPSCQ